MGIALLVGVLVALLPLVFIATPLAGLIAAVAANPLALFVASYFTVRMAERNAIVADANFRSAALGAAIVGDVIGWGIARQGGDSSVPMP